MEPTSVTALVMVVFAIALIGFTVRLYFWSWETRYPRRFIEVEDDEVEDAVRQMRREIEEWERRNAA